LNDLAEKYIAAVERPGPAAEPARPVLIRWTSDKDLHVGVRIRAMRTLERIGAALAAVEPALLATTHDPALSLEAVEVLHRMGSESDEFVRSLIRVLGEAGGFSASKPGEAPSYNFHSLPYYEHERRERAKFGEETSRRLTTLGRKEPGRIVPLLVEGFRASARSRDLVTHVMGEIGPPAQGAVSALASAVSLSEEEISTLMKIGGFPALATALKTGTPEVRLAVFKRLRQHGPDAVPLLDEARNDPDEHVRRDAFDALARLAAGSPQAVSALVVARRDEPWPEARARVETLLGVGLWPAFRAGAGFVAYRAWTSLSPLGWSAGALVVLLVWLRRRRLGQARKRRDCEDRRELLTTPGALATRYLRTLTQVADQTPKRFLHPYPEASPRQQCDVLLADQGFRWRQGQPRSVERYLDRYPVVAADEDLVLDLVAAECRLAVAHGARAQAENCLAAYAHLGDRLRHRLEGLDAAAGGDGPDLPATDVPEPTVARGARPIASAETRLRVPRTRDDATRTYAVRSLASTDAMPDPDDATVDLPSRPGSGAAAGRAARIGRYTIERVLGVGTFGTVYEARDDELHRRVAVKVPRHERVAREEDIEAYLAEARVVAGLDHPWIVPVYDFGRTDDGLCYVVSKLIPGQDLARRLQQARPTPTAAAAMVAQAAEALEHAHRRGLVHRDIKPANLLLDQQGNVYVADFGLALAMRESGEGSQLAGTPAYMSPEQAGGEVFALDGRSDVFSLGVVFYELMTGVKPFQGASLKQILSMVQRLDPVPPWERDAAIPRELVRICMRCLAKAPADRFASAGDLAVALRRWQQAGVGSHNRIDILALAAFGVLGVTFILLAVFGATFLFMQEGSIYDIDRLVVVGIVLFLMLVVALVRIGVGLGKRSVTRGKPGGHDPTSKPDGRAKAGPADRGDNWDELAPVVPR